MQKYCEINVDCMWLAPRVYNEYLINLETCDQYECNMDLQWMKHECKRNLAWEGHMIVQEMWYVLMEDAINTIVYNECGIVITIHSRHAMQSVFYHKSKSNESTPEHWSKIWRQWISKSITVIFKHEDTLLRAPGTILLRDLRERQCMRHGGSRRSVTARISASRLFRNCGAWQLDRVSQPLQCDTLLVAKITCKHGIMGELLQPETRYTWSLIWSQHNDCNISIW